MNDGYLQSIWKEFDETFAHDCIVEIYKKQGYNVKNFHKDDRKNENGVDVLCKKNRTNITFAVKKKPGTEDIKQLNQFEKNPEKIKSYIFLAPPTKPFENEMEKCKSIEFWNWQRFHEELIRQGSRKYILAYFSVHPLFLNLYKIYKILYDHNAVKFIKHKLTGEEITVLWNIKDDTVKFKAVLDYVKDRWNIILMEKIDYDTTEYAKYIEEIHSELNDINSKFAKVLLASFQNLKQKFPHILGTYWDLASCRTNWKTFTSKSVIIGKSGEIPLKKYIINDWVLPNLDDGKYSGVMRNFYSTLYYLLENTFEIAKDLEDGVDWVREKILP